MTTKNIKTNHCILGQRKLKMHELVTTQQHNSREIEVANADPEARPPRVFRGCDNIVIGVAQKMSELGIKPKKRGVVALELMFAFSSEHFAGMSKMQAAYAEVEILKAMCEYLKNRFPEQATVNIITHNDEKTFHIHAIVLPVYKGIDNRTSDKAEKWMMSARGFVGKSKALSDEERAKSFSEPRYRVGVGNRSQMSFEQTKFAEFFAHLNLRRGQVWSNERNKPARVWQEEQAKKSDDLDAEIKAAAANKIALETAAKWADDRLRSIDEIIKKRIEKELEEKLKDRLKALDEREAQIAARELETASIKIVIEEQKEKIRKNDAWIKNEKKELDERSKKLDLKLLELGPVYRLSELLIDYSNRAGITTQHPMYGNVANAASKLFSVVEESKSVQPAIAAARHYVAPSRGR